MTTQHVITTPAFRDGQAQAQRDYHDGSSAPNHQMLDHRAAQSAADAEWVAGYRDEWQNFIEPLIQREQQKL